jgi:hypothetical protein
MFLLKQSFQSFLTESIHQVTGAAGRAHTEVQCFRFQEVEASNQASISDASGLASGTSKPKWSARGDIKIARFLSGWSVQTNLKAYHYDTSKRGCELAYELFVNFR